MLRPMDVEMIESLEEELRLAMLHSDTSQLDTLLSPSLTFTTFLGEKIDKAHDLAAHRSGYLKMHSIKISDARVWPFVDVAVVTCCAEIDATFDGDRTNQLFRFTRVWSKNTEGAYQVIVGQATMVLPAV